MYKTRDGGPPAQGGSILGALQASNMVDARSRLPAETMVIIINYLPVADQMRMARASRRLQEMIYDDTRWVSRLKGMGCWNENEARHRFEESVRRRRDAAAAAAAAAVTAGNNQPNGVDGRQRQATTATLFDATVEQQEQQWRKRATSELRDGFETMTLGTNGPNKDPTVYLDIFKNAKSIRGGARQEYSKIYGALAPFYFDLIRAKTHAEPVVFKAFRDPERQAQMLANLRRFSGSDWAEGWNVREGKLISMMSIFESAVLREFEQGYEFWDVDGRMHRYAHVLHTLNGAKSGIDLFIQKHPLLSDRELVVNPMECLNQAGSDDITLEPSRLFLEKLLAKVNEQANILERIFPEPEVVFWKLVEKIAEDIVAEYTTPLFDEAHERSVASYLKAVSGVFEQAMRFFQFLRPLKDSKEEAQEKTNQLILRVFEPHLDLYLQEELDYFTKQAETEVFQWERKLSEQDSTLESFYMSNINRSAEKNDFLSSFKKVIMMPVTVLPSFPIGSPFATTKPATSSASITTNGSAAATPMPSRPQTPRPGQGRSSPMPGARAPTDELAAKAAIMTSKLEGIKSLFSIEVALDLVHKAKSSLGRAAVLIPLGGQVGGEAREQCANIFIALLRILGRTHIKHGFDVAVDHLSQYNPREVSNHDQKGVAPLVMFIELVNVGDLISQMIDVFYEQQLAAPKIADKNDFLDPAGLAKKKFEQMLDESVAAGLNKGIDVLMDEVEYLQGTMQQPADYNPIPRGSGDDNTRATMSSMAELDIGPTPTARRIVDLVRSHTSMLVGTTEKSMLDVFNGEVGQRLFTAICKHLKRQRISTDGAVKLISDMNLFSDYIRTLKNPDLLPYFGALRELSQIYLIDPGHAKEMATVIADGDRFGGVFRAEEVYEYAQRRADWYQVKRSVERAMYGMDCTVM